MAKELWQETLLPSGNEDFLWELFHENSKIGPHHEALSDQEVRARMNEFHESLSYEGYPLVELPSSLSSVNLSLLEAIATRTSVRELTPCPLTLEQVGTLLHCAYGVNRDNTGTPFPRPFRVVPSGGALYPLEIFFHSAYIEGLPAGLYHYNPSKNHLRRLQEGEATDKIADTIVQPEIARGASLILFITAIFERSVFKYGDRGYRFVMLEAGHVAQNVNLVSVALGLGCLNIGGFLDRQVDDFLSLDGVTHSTIYMIAIGGRMK